MAHINYMLSSNKVCGGRRIGVKLRKSYHGPEFQHLKNDLWNKTRPIEQGSERPPISFSGVFLFGLLAVLCLFLFAPIAVGCSSDENETETNGAGNVSPDWYSGSIVESDPVEYTVTVAIEEPRRQEVVFSLEKLSDTYKEWAFSVMEPGDSVSASCLSCLVAKGNGVNMAVSFKIQGHEDEEADICSKNIADTISIARELAANRK